MAGCGGELAGLRVRLQAKVGPGLQALLTQLRASQAMLRAGLDEYRALLAYLGESPASQASGEQTGQQLPACAASMHASQAAGRVPHAWAVYG